MWDPIKPGEYEVGTARATLGDVHEAAREADILGRNSDARFIAHERAYTERNDLIRSAFGVELENPVSGFYSDYIEWQKRNPYTLFGRGREDPDVARTRILSEHHARYKSAVDALLKKHPDALDLIGVEPDPREAAADMAREAEERAGELAASRDDLLTYGALFTGGFTAAIRDPLQAPLFLLGGGPGAARTVAGRILTVAAKEAAISGLSEAALQPFVQDWRREAGLSHGLGDAAEAVGFATVLGGIFGGGFRGLYEGGAAGARALRGRRRPEPPAEVRGAADEMEADAAWRESRPRDVPEGADDLAASRALEVAEDPEAFGRVGERIGPTLGELAANDPELPAAVRTLLDQLDEAPAGGRASGATEADAGTGALGADEIAETVGALGGGIADGLYRALWKRVEAGKTTENGEQSVFLQAAKAVRESGGLAAYDDFKRFVRALDAAIEGKAGADYQAAVRSVIGDEIARTEKSAGKPADAAGNGAPGAGRAETGPGGEAEAPARTGTGGERPAGSPADDGIEFLDDAETPPFEPETDGPTQAEILDAEAKIVERPDLPRFGAEKAARPKVRRPTSLLSFLAGSGIRDEGGELAALDLTHRSMFGPGRPLVRKNGMTLDHAREVAAEAGFMHNHGPPELAMETTTVADLLDLIAEEAGGSKVYSEHDFDAVRQWADYDEFKADREEWLRHEDEVREAAGPDMHERFVTRATDFRMGEGMEIEDALERAIMEDYHAYGDGPLERADGSEILDDDIPFDIGPQTQREPGAHAGEGRDGGAQGEAGRSGEGDGRAGGDEGQAGGEAREALDDTPANPAADYGDLEVADLAVDADGNLTVTTRSLGEAIAEADRDRHLAGVLENCKVI